MPRVLTCHKITKAHRGEGDHDKVNGLQGGPSLNILENDSRDRHKYNAAGQDEQDGGDDPDLGLAHLLFLGEQRRKTGKSALSPWVQKMEAQEECFMSVAFHLSSVMGSFGRM